jgi:hypothetical protein
MDRSNEEIANAACSGATIATQAALAAGAVGLGIGAALAVAALGATVALTVMGVADDGIHFSDGDAGAS